MPWEQLRDIACEYRDVVQDEQTRPPEACPNDGEPLAEGPDGELFCKWDGWRPGGRYVGS